MTMVVKKKLLNITKQIKMPYKRKQRPNIGICQKMSEQILKFGDIVLMKKNFMLLNKQLF